MPEAWSIPRNPLSDSAPIRRLQPYGIQLVLDHQKWPRAWDCRATGQPTRFRKWQDTVLLAPCERVEMVFVADNLGDCMFHRHILEHWATGMMSTTRVT